MKFIRLLGKFFGTIIFTTFLILSILTIELVNFTSYENVKALLSEILKNQLFSTFTEEQINQAYSMLSLACLQNDTVNIPGIKEIGIEEITLKCDEVSRAGKNGFIDLAIAKLVDKLYYKTFACSFLNCIKENKPENMVILISNQGNLFYKNIQIYSIAGALIGLVLLLISTESWIDRLKITGSNLALVGLPFLFVNYIETFLLKSFQLQASSALTIFDKLVTSLANKFIIVFVFGVVLLVIGYSLGFYLSRKRKKSQPR